MKASVSCQKPESLHPWLGHVFDGRGCVLILFALSAESNLNFFFILYHREQQSLIASLEEKLRSLMEEMESKNVGNVCALFILSTLIIY